ncbi:MAG: universal stress protein [Rhodospirillales bacterium]|nr:universal stress protein [Rhodospirillales bacterium]
MYERILLSIDLNDGLSWEAPLEKALTLCRTFNSSLHVVNVIPDLNIEVMQLYLPDDTEQNLIQSVTESLQGFIENNIPSEIGAVACISQGSIYSAVLKTAKEVKADVIIIGSHRPTMGDFLLGPNAARVVRHADCSVLVVRS